MGPDLNRLHSTGKTTVIRLYIADEEETGHDKNTAVCIIFILVFLSWTHTPPCGSGNLIFHWV